MKATTKAVLTIGVMVFAVTSLLARSNSPHNSKSLRFAVREKMENLGIEPDASGRVTASESQRRGTTRQQLDIQLRGLTPNTTYSLFAATGATSAAISQPITLPEGDTNQTDVVTNPVDVGLLSEVLTFTTDRRGRASLRFRDISDTDTNPDDGDTNGDTNAEDVVTGDTNVVANPNHGRDPLPDALNPVTDILQLAVVNANVEAVLVADLTAPDRLQFLLKQNVSTNDVDATLQVRANTRQTRVRLRASGLEPMTEHALLFDGGVVETDAADSSGRLNISSTAATPAQVLDLNTIELRDGSDNEILTTDVP